MGNFNKFIIGFWFSVRSVNTPDFDPAVWLINPDVSDLEGRRVPERYWKVVRNDVVEMTQPEKDVVDTPEPDPLRDSATVKLKSVVGLTDAEITRIHG